MTNFSAFLKDETGAVTVDWVVLTAAVVGLGLLVFQAVQPAVDELSQGIAGEVRAAGGILGSGTGGTGGGSTTP